MDAVLSIGRVDKVKAKWQVAWALRVECPASMAAWEKGPILDSDV